MLLSAVMQVMLQIVLRKLITFTLKKKNSRILAGGMSCDVYRKLEMSA